MAVRGLFRAERETPFYYGGNVASIIIQLDPAKLSNPDLDITCVLPDLIVERSGGRLADDGFDYAGEGPTQCLLLFLSTEDVDAALPAVVDVLKSEQVLGNDLSSVPVAVEYGHDFRVVHPPGFTGVFARTLGR